MAINHAKHITADQLGQAKKLQASLKKVEAAKRAKTFVEKALSEVTTTKDETVAWPILLRPSWAVFFAEKESTTQALLAEKVARANAKHALVETKKWQEGEPSRLAIVK